MRKRILCYGLWLWLVCCLYFFENNAGTLTVLACTLLLPLFPAIWLHAPVPNDENKRRRKRKTLLIPDASHQEEEEPGDLRGYLPGDPVNRIHWKLSAKRDELLIREGAREEAEAEIRTKTMDSEDSVISPERKSRWIWLMAGILLCSLLLLFLHPEARRGAQALLNRLYEASEQVNSYVYKRFPVDAEQSLTLSVCLLGIFALSLLSLLFFSGSRSLALGLMAGCVFFQVYFGLAFPAWANVLLLALFALWTLARPWNRKRCSQILVLITAVSLSAMIFLPGTNEAVESASENVRDWLSLTAQQIAGTVHETAEGEKEIRRTHTQSLTTGDQEARPDREFRLVAVEEEQISMPRWINYLRIIFLLFLTVATVILPFLPFLWLNARQKKAAEMREAFKSEQISEAVCAIFQHVIAWLEATKNDAGNLPYTQWAEHLREDVPEHYSDRFAQCSAIFEEAAYSNHQLTKEHRRKVLILLEETEKWLLSKADWKQKFFLKYGKCLYQ